MEKEELIELEERLAEELEIREEFGCAWYWQW